MSAQSQINFIRCERSFQLRYSNSDRENTRLITHALGAASHTSDNQDHDALNPNHHTTGHSLTELTGLAWSEVTTKQSRLAHATTD